MNVIIYDNNLEIYKKFNNLNITVKLWYLLGYNRERDQTENAWGSAAGNKKRTWPIRGHPSGSPGHPVQLLRPDGDWATVQYL